MPSEKTDFERCNIFEQLLSPIVAHRGTGTIDFCRIVESHNIAGACNFIDFSCMPPGSTIGEHTHTDSEEEYYLVLKGEGLMRRGDDEFVVKPGDLIRNPPGGTHSLKNTGSDELQLFIFELRVQ